MGGEGDALCTAGNRGGVRRRPKRGGLADHEPLSQREDPLGIPNPVAEPLPRSGGAGKAGQLAEVAGTAT